MIQKRLFYLLIAILGMKLIWASFMVLFGPVHLSPDEAQYWTWSQNLDWGYYSKPPGVAWQIALGTLFFGNTEFGVRFVGLLFSFALPLATFALARSCRLSEKVSFGAALIIAFCPVGIMASFTATTDGGLVLFWTLAFAVLLKKASPNFILFGLLVLLGLLFKWTLLLIWIPVLIGFFIYPQWRTINVLWGILISFLGLLPSVIWNASHEWVTFRHVWTQSSAAGGGAPNPLDFLFAQMGLFFPVFFILLIGAFFSIRKAESPLRFCIGCVLGILLVYELLSFKQKMQANWAVYVYPLASVAVAWYAFDIVKRGKLWYYLGLYLSIGLTLIVMNSVPFIPYKMNLFKPALGWDKLPGILEKAGYDPKTDFLLADNYQMTSLLSFYSPGQKRAYFINIPGHRKNQFSFWPGMKDEQLHQDGFFVTTSGKEPEAIEKILAPYFEKVTFVEKESLFEDKKWAVVFKCLDYNGLTPKDPEKY